MGDERILAHSLVLASRSPVVLAMLSSTMRENQERLIEIPDLDVAAGEELVSFLYTGELDRAMLRTDESAPALLQAARRYDVPAVVEKCTRVLGTRLSVETVPERLELADMIECASFKTQRLDFIRQHIHEVQRTRSYGRLAVRRPPLLRDIIAALAGPANNKRRPHAVTDAEVGRPPPRLRGQATAPTIFK